MDTAWRWRRHIEMLIHHLCHAPLKGSLPGEQFVGHHSESVLVGLGNRFAQPLFRSHIGGSTTNILARYGCGGDEFGNPKISRTLLPRSEFADRFQIARFRGFMDRINGCSGLVVEMRCLYNITRSSLSCSWLPIIQCGFCLQSIPDHLRFVKRFFAKNWPSRSYSVHIF